MRGVPEGSLFNYLMNSSGRDQLGLGFTRKCLGRRLFLSPMRLLTEEMGRVNPQYRPALQSWGGRDVWEAT